MKRIRFLDSNHGVWTYEGDMRRGINFRDVLRQAKSIETAIGGEVSINFIHGEHWQDITEWVKRKSV